MINCIEIENFATIENIAFELGPELNIITGETGAGKSVLVTAISTALGGRADTSMVRSGCSKAIIRIAGDRNGEEVILTREILASGKSIARINGEMATLGQLRNYCSDWVDIHGQYDNQQILDPDNHITVTDSFRRELMTPELTSLEKLYTDYREARHRYEELLRTAAVAEQQQEFYKFEYSYIQGLHLTPGEDEELRSQLELMKNGAKIYSSVMGSYHLLHESETSILNALNAVLSDLDSASAYSDRLSSLHTQTEEAYYSLEDVSSALRDIAESLDFSEETIDAVQERLSIIEDAKRKYHKTVEEILEYGAELGNRLSVIENFDSEKKALSEAADKSYQLLEAQASRVSMLRHTVAAKLEDSIKKELKDLDFANSDFSISISRLNEIGPLGYDNVEFLISTNPGEPLSPLTRIASGGEISRIMLAFKHIIGESDKVETMIFDEIDTGISGRTALTVGRKMKELSGHTQIISITHLPQIAAYGDDNYLITKSISGDRSITNIDHLDSDSKVKMVATLFSGSDNSSSALNAAEELIERVKR